MTQQQYEELPRWKRWELTTTDEYWQKRNARRRVMRKLRDTSERRAKEVLRVKAWRAARRAKGLPVNAAKKPNKIPYEEIKLWLEKTRNANPG